MPGMQGGRKVTKFHVARVVRGSAPVAAVVSGHHPWQCLDTRLRARAGKISLRGTNPCRREAKVDETEVFVSHT